MDIVPKLQMNLHPKDATNLSLVTARNVKLSNDESCITNEESIFENEFIKNYLNNYYNNAEHSVVGVIPCNNELVIIAINNKVQPHKAQIFRYREKTISTQESMKCVYGDSSNNYLKYHNGKIKGTFTYNVENSLIVAIAEYDGDVENIPLRTINLGNYDNEDIHNDKDIPNSMLSISPEVYIPSMYNLQYISGSAYKGWYYLFIRYKINSIDYTQWFNFGFPVYVDTLKKQSITKYCYRQKITGISRNEAAQIVTPEEPDDGFCVGATDYFSDTNDLANETFKIDIRFNRESFIYKKYQIGLICCSKKYTKSFRTNDIDLIGNNVFIFKEFILDNKSVIDASVSDFITDNYNYFDVKNIINYKNRLYIANYKETNINDKNIIDSDIINRISLHLNKDVIYGSRISYDYTITTKENVKKCNNQYDAGENGIPISEYLNINQDVVVTIIGNCTKYTKDNTTTIERYEDSFKASFISIMEKTSDFTIQNDGGVKRTFTNPSLTSVVAKIRDNNNNVIIYKFDGGITIKLSTDTTDECLAIPGNDQAINKGVKYINVNTSFNDRKKQKTLIEGEVYNFFIHFVDKYGHSTNGYKLNNSHVWTTEDDSNTEIVPIPFYYNSTTIYAAIPVNENVLYDGKLNIYGLKLYRGIERTRLTNRILDDTSANLETYYTEAFKKVFSSFENDNYNNVKWFQISSGYGSNEFLPYYNNNGDKLFKVPIERTDGDKINKYGFYVSDVIIPNGYIGWFISYEKFEPIKRVTGVLTRNDFITQKNFWPSEGDIINFNTINRYKTDSIYFYSGQYDIIDSIKLGYNLMRIDSINCFDTEDIQTWDYNQRSGAYKYCYDYNKPQLSDSIDYNGAPACYAMPEYKLVVANSVVDNRVGVGTALQIKDSYNLFPNASDNYVKIYKVSLFNSSRDIYMSNNKTLIRCTNIIYSGIMSKDDVFPNGVMTYDGCIIYNGEGFSFNTANMIAYRNNVNTKYYPSEVNGKHTYEINRPFMAYLQFPCVDDHFYESKCFNNPPTGYAFYVKQATQDLDKANENNKFADGCIVTPANTIDLFQNNQDSYDAFIAKTYSNYKSDLAFINNFEKTIRRSTIIQDETRVNGWRTFPIESYKNITENKGVITNLIGIGTVLLVHTEHSLFMFDVNNTLETKDKTVQLTQPDSFEVAYKEVFTSNLGFGGLQDDKSYIIDQFGYIFYNNDFKHFYKFDNGALDIIDDNIVQWLNKYSPYNVRFGNDKFNNRILIKMNYLVNNEEKDIVISYNYNTHNFISLHDYYFDEAYNTKSQLYLRCDKERRGCSFHQFVQDGNSYGCFDNIKDEAGMQYIAPSKIGIIVNEHYEYVKFLEHISYKLNKFVNPTEIDYTNFPVERHVKPYSGDGLRVYNNETDTGDLNILINKEELKNKFGNYNEPYWELGMWNYNYLRNNIANYGQYGSAFEMSRLYGNYFVIEFTFFNSDMLKVEFEELRYNITR